MKESNLPELLDLLNMNVTDDNLEVFSKVINSPSSFYRKFTIKKRSGGNRLITAPYPTLAYIQSLIYKNLLQTIDISHNAFAYAKNKNTIGHAKRHCDSKELLTLDLKDFFPSITKQNVFNVFESISIDSKISNYLSYLCCYKNTLPQGACTSPSLSNIIFKPIDIRLTKIAHSYNLEYSRYADDLAFSGEKVPRMIIELIGSVLNEYGFTLNKKKTKLKLDGYKKILTGISISEKELKAPKKFKRDLRAKIYELEKFEFELFKMTNFTPTVYEETLGKLNYLLQIEPDNLYAINKLKTVSESYRNFKYLIA